MTDTVQQLHELPDLAAEVYLTWGHPNPSEQPVVQVKRIHPRAPADLDTLDALRPDKLGLLHRLAQCVRAVVEDMPEHLSLPMTIFSLTCAGLEAIFGSLS